MRQACWYKLLPETDPIPKHHNCREGLGATEQIPDIDRHNLPENIFGSYCGSLRKSLEVFIMR